MINGINFELNSDAVNMAQSEKDKDDAFYMCLQYGFCPKCSSELKHENQNKLGIIVCTNEKCDFKFDWNKKEVINGKQDT